MTKILVDTETTHTDRFFTQITQLAAIKVDEDLNVTDRLDVRARLMPHVLAHPGALLVTGVGYRSITSHPVTHFQMMRQVQETFRRWGPAEFVGHNLIEFDEHMIRQGLYQSLIDPYLLQKAGCTRSDTLQLARLANACGVDGITVPTIEGKLSFKLGTLLSANGIVLENAHDAMADTLGVLALLRLLRARAPALCELMGRMADKRQVMAALDGTSVLSFKTTFFGRPFSMPATLVTYNPDRTSEALIFDLAQDPNDYFGLSVEELADVIAGVTKPRAIRSLKTTGVPFLAPLDHALVHRDRFAVSAATMEARANVIRQNAEFREKVALAAKAAQELKAEEYGEDPEVEPNIYSGFPSKADNDRMTDFHAKDAHGRIALVNEFEDERLREIAMRIVAQEHPDLAPVPIRDGYQELVRRRHTGAPGCKWISRELVLMEIERLLATASPEQAAILTEYRDALRSTLAPTLA